MQIAAILLCMMPVLDVITGTGQMRPGSLFHVANLTICLVQSIDILWGRPDYSFDFFEGDSNVRNGNARTLRQN